MKEAWDFVSFANYEKDMNDLTERSVAVADYHARQIKAREAVIWALVKAAGGRVSVDIHDLHERPKNWEIRDDPATNSRIFIIKATAMGEVMGNGP